MRTGCAKREGVRGGVGWRVFGLVWRDARCAVVSGICPTSVACWIAERTCGLSASLMSGRLPDITGHPTLDEVQGAALRVRAGCPGLGLSQVV